MPSPLIIAAVVIGAFAALSGGKRRKRTTSLTFEDEHVGGHVEPDVLPPSGSSQWPVRALPAPIIVGDPKNPDVASLLMEMEDLFRAQGVDLSVVTAEEVTRMPKAPGQPVAIPPREFWPRMAQTLRLVFMPLRAAMGKPLSLRGYRPADYNAAVDGAPGSRHQWFEGFDIRVVDGTAADRRRLATLAAQMYAERGAEYQMGLGIYKDTLTVHGDTGYDQRTWGEADYWVDQVGRAA